MTQSAPDPAPPLPAEQVRGLNRELGAGLLLLALGLVGFLGSYSLKFTLASGVGPGLMPRVTALIVAAFGLLLVVQAFTTAGERLESWSLRGIVFLLGAVVAFAVTIRGFSIPLPGLTLTCPALGLVVAGPLALITAALADRETRLVEIIPYALILTAACIVLFKYVLRQPIPIAPFLLGY